ncbi:MAG TPA: SDR family oxidoreductase [Stellaceae bacterium]|nr:SDR family oxidoreductase [Stellaceae bacterium]
MPALDGKIVVITGATSGIGLATAEALATSGARLVLLARDPAKGAAALARLKELNSACDADVLYADLSRLDAVRKIAAALEALPRLDVLVNNAGAIFNRRAETEDRLERTFALNHMNYYLLTRLLLPRLAASAPARIVNVASGAHRGAQLDFNDLQMARGYRGRTAYQRSKLCNILFTRELARRIVDMGVTANCLHPGFVATGFGDNTDGLFRIALSIGKRLVAISPARGAETVVYLATAPEVASKSGLYFGECRVETPSTAARDDVAALKLWNESARIAGLPAA